MLVVIEFMDCEVLRFALKVGVGVIERRGEGRMLYFYWTSVEEELSWGDIS